MPAERRDCRDALSLICKDTFAVPGSKDPATTADIHKPASQRPSRRGTVIPNAEIGFDPEESVKSKSGIYSHHTR